MAALHRPHVRMLVSDALFSDLLHVLANHLRLRPRLTASYIDTSYSGCASTRRATRHGGDSPNRALPSGVLRILTHGPIAPNPHLRLPIPRSLSFTCAQKRHSLHPSLLTLSLSRSMFSRRSTPPSTHLAIDRPSICWVFQARTSPHRLTRRFLRKSRNASWACSQTAWTGSSSPLSTMSGCRGHIAAARAARS